MRALLVTLMMAAVVFAGCADDAAPTTTIETGDGDEKELRRGTGGILGLVIDDRFRPIPGALVLIQPAGVTAEANDNGEFEVADLEPGAYSLRVSADGHEAAPATVTVAEGEFVETSVLARRATSSGSTILTQEYSVFITCAADFIANGIVYDCTLDQSGDTDRSSFDSDYTDVEGITYMVTEMKANQGGRYEVQVRAPTNETDDTADYYAAAQFEGDYVKIVNKLGERQTEWEAIDSYGENEPFDNAWPFQTILFPDSEYREELQGTGAPVCCGVGARIGIRAQFVQSVFIGEPEVDINSYAVLA